MNFLFLAARAGCILCALQVCFAAHRLAADAPPCDGSQPSTTKKYCAVGLDYCFGQNQGGCNRYAIVTYQRILDCVPGTGGTLCGPDPNEDTWVLCQSQYDCIWSDTRESCTIDITNPSYERVPGAVLLDCTGG